MKGFRRFDDLSWKYMLTYKKRTIYTILGIMLAVFLFFGAGTIYVSIRHANFLKAVYQYGDYDCSAEVTPSEYASLKESDRIQEMLVCHEDYFNCIEKEDAESDDMNGVTSIYYALNYDQDIMKMELLEGRYPENDRELMICNEVAELYNYQVGDTIPIYYSEYWDGDVKAADEYREALDYLREKEEEDGKERYDYSIEDVFTKKAAANSYLVCGIYGKKVTNREYMPKYNVMYSCLNVDNGYSTLSVYIKLKKHESVSALVKETNIDLLEHTGKISLEGDFAYTDLEYILFVMAFAILFWIGVIIIRNSFVTSVAERSRDYGILRCMGTSQHKLRRLLIREGLLEVFAGYILGIALTVLAIEVGRSIPSIRGLLYSIGIYDFFHVKFNVWITLGSLLLVLGAVLFSLIEPARQLGAVSPISAILGHLNIRKEHFRKRDGSFFRKILGVEGEYAYKNVLRNRGKFVAAMVGTAVSVVGIVISFSLLNIMQYVLDVDKLQDMYSGNAEFNKESDITNASIEVFGRDLEELDSIEAAYPVFGMETEMYSDTDIGKLTADDKDNIFLHGIEEAELQELEPVLLEGSLDMEAFRKGGVIICRNRLINVLVAGEYIKNMRVIESQQEVHVGDTVLISQESMYVSRQLSDAEWQEETKENLAKVGYMECPVIAVIDYYPGKITSTNDVLMDKAYYQATYGADKANGTGLHEIRLKYSKDYDNVEVTEFLKEHLSYNIQSDDVLDSIMEMKGYQQLILILAVVIAGIGAVNIFSTLSANITQRQSELKVLHAVGMSRKQIWKMLGLEGALAAIFGSIIGILIGILIGFLLTLFAQELKDGFAYYGVKYQLPVIGILLSFLLAGVITGGSLLVAYRDMKLWEE